MKKIIGLVVAIGLVAVLIGYKMYNKPHRSVEEESSISISASELFNQFRQNEEQANSTFLNKAVEVTGVVSEVFKNQDGMQVIVLKTADDLYGISCTMDHDQPIHVGAVVTIKGFCMGYLSDVVINNGKIANKK
jgi:hypothetical protein